MNDTDQAKLDESDGTEDCDVHPGVECDDPWHCPCLNDCCDPVEDEEESSPTGRLPAPRGSIQELKAQSFRPLDPEIFPYGGYTA
jgi:hypothetical protein